MRPSDPPSPTSAGISPHPELVEGRGRAPEPSADERIPRVTHLKNRPQFLACQRGPSAARGAVAIQQLARGDGDPTLRAGFTATKKIGNAVVRNRAKRRLREAARALLPLHGQPGSDYVFVARMGTAERPWARLIDDVRSALVSLSHGGDPPRAPRSRASAPQKRPPPAR